MAKSNFRKFLLLWAGEFVSSIGGGLTSFGLGVYIFNETGSAANMALVTLLAFLPTLILSVPAGVLADRYDRRLLMMLGDGLSAIGLLYILFRMFSGGASLLDICIGVTISSVFSSLLAPSYRATVTDLLTEEEYSKASGLVSLADSARYLISPFLAGLLLSFSDITLLLIIDACTFFLTVFATGVVRRGLETKERKKDEGILQSFRSGWKIVTANRGVFVLIIASAMMTLFLGFIQILGEPLILAFSDSSTLGTSETICACGMLVTSLYLGIRGIKKRYVVTLSVSLALAGAAMIVFGIWENIVIICASGFFFFAMMPFGNTALDYLVRTNIPDEAQGRAWGLIGFLSQIGYVAAYATAGVLADALGSGLGIGVGRGAGMAIIGAGILLIVVGLSLLLMKSVKELEKASLSKAG